MDIKVYTKNGDKLYLTLNKKQFNKLKKDVIKINYDKSLTLKNGDRIELY